MDLTAAIIAVVVALIAATPSLVATVVSNRKTRAENESQHGASKEALDNLRGTVDSMHLSVVGIDGKVDTLGERVAVVEHTVGIVHNHLQEETRAITEE